MTDLMVAVKRGSVAVRSCKYSFHLFISQILESFQTFLTQLIEMLLRQGARPDDSQDQVLCRVFAPFPFSLLLHWDAIDVHKTMIMASVV